MSTEDRADPGVFGPVESEPEPDTQPGWTRLESDDPRVIALMEAKGDS